MARGVQVGDKAPDFTLPSQSGEPVRLADRLGERVVVLYFYPKDETPGCTAEACAFRDSHRIRGVDTPASRRMRKRRCLHSV
jgi:thioredoxin-dependent peroxiredoxin